MEEYPNRAPFTLSGKAQYQRKSFLALLHSSLVVSTRRLLRGPQLPNWSWMFETSTHLMRAQARIAFDMPNPADSREYEDALVFYSSAMPQVDVVPVAAPIKGHWYQPKSDGGEVTVLYLHGGGYHYYPKALCGLIALVALAAKARTFAVDYRLAPEYPFPAQLEDARASYLWLLEEGTKPERLVVIGDSAGGNLTLALMLALRDAHLPLPALAIGISPWTDLENSGESMTKNEPYDWIEKRMAVKWAEWLCQGANLRDPRISPLHADLTGLPPIYIQAGSAEILYDMIRAFADKAQAQGANVLLDVWKNMTHDFQAFGESLPESQEALRRIGQMVEKYAK